MRSLHDKSSKFYIKPAWLLKAPLYGCPVRVSYNDVQL